MVFGFFTRNLVDTFVSGDFESSFVFLIEEIHFGGEDGCFLRLVLDMIRRFWFDFLFGEGEVDEVVGRYRLGVSPGTF